MSRTELKCTSCGAEDVQRLSMVYQAGTSVINTTTRGSTTGVGVGRGGLGFGSASTRQTTTGTQRTQLAERAAPPARRPAVLLVVLGIVLSLIGGAIGGPLLGLPVLAGFGFFAWQGFVHNSSAYPALRERWERSWLCHRCGDIFTT